MLVDGGGPGFGSPGFIRGFDTANGDLLWQIDLHTVNGSDELNWSHEPAFTPDSQTAYVTTRFTSNANWGYLYAVQIGNNPPPQPAFVRGDANGDGSFNIADAIVLLDSLFGGASIACEDAADCNDDDSLDISDPISVLGALFGVPSVPPQAPHPDCGSDPTPGTLGCAAFPLCP